MSNLLQKYFEASHSDLASVDLGDSAVLLEMARVSKALYSPLNRTGEQLILRLYQAALASYEGDEADETKIILELAAQQIFIEDDETLSEAERNLKRIVDRDPQNIDALRLLIKTLSYEVKPREVIQRMEALSIASPLRNEDGALTQLYFAYRHENRLKDAERVALAAIDLFTDSAEWKELLRDVRERMQIKDELHL